MEEADQEAGEDVPVHRDVSAPPVLISRVSRWTWTEDLSVRSEMFLLPPLHTRHNGADLKHGRHGDVQRRGPAQVP